VPQRDGKVYRRMAAEVRARVEEEIAELARRADAAGDLEVRLELAYRERDEAREALAPLEAEVLDLTRSADHWHSVAEAYVIKAARIAKALAYLGGAETIDAQTELVNATPDDAVPHVEGLSPALAGQRLFESAVPRRKQPPGPGAGRYPSWR
jgi:hypothetical protein